MNNHALKLSLLCIVLCCLVSGCSLTHNRNTAGPHVPAPVTDQGMTLDWGADVKQAALHLIQSSRKRCYLDIYELSDPDILAALAAAKHRGVDTRVVVDATETHSQGTAIPTLQADGVPVESLHIPSGISHVKMLVSDGQVLIGGMNFGAGSWSNNDASVWIPEANPSFAGLFLWDWSRAGGNPAEESSNELPLVTDRNIEAVMVEAIQSATKDISMEAFDLSDYAVVDALDAAVKRGIPVQILLDPGQTYSRKAAERLSGDGASIRWYLPYAGEWMHAKILDVDDGSRFIIGSANFSHQAFTYNHEADVYLRDVPKFHDALKENLSLQFDRGTDSPTPHTYRS